jgi:RimJ/RimL family protein N-acetyltransferase
LPGSPLRRVHEDCDESRLRFAKTFLERFAVAHGRHGPTVRLRLARDERQRIPTTTTLDVAAADPLEESRARDSGILSDDRDRDPVREFGFDPLLKLRSERTRTSHELSLGIAARDPDRVRLRDHSRVMRNPLATDRLRFRPLTEADEKDVVRIIGDEHVAARDVRDAVVHWRDHGFGPYVALERASGEVVGVIELHRAGDGLVGIDPDEIEIGWLIEPERRGEGLATEAAAAVLAQGLALSDHVVAYVRRGNEASDRVAEKIGMRYERDGQARDGQPVRIYIARRER